MATVKDMMTRNPICLNHDEPVLEAARLMDRHDIGDVLVLKDGKVMGICTDRDIVVRCLAQGMDVNDCTVGDVCTGRVVAIEPNADLHEAAHTMREHKIRRVPVMEDGHAVGILSLGDLAEKADRESVLGEISDAPPNN